MKKYNGYVDSVKAEFAERVFSSRKRVIKFIAICFVPFLYAFICIWAFWDPIPKIGEAPMAIISNDTQIDFIVGRTGEDNLSKIGAGEAISYFEGGPSGPEKEITDETNWDEIPDKSVFVTSAGTKIIKSPALIHNKMSLLDNLTDAWKSGAVENISYNPDKDKFSIKVNDQMSITNLTYLNGQKAKDIAEQKEDGSWKVKDDNKYWVQMQMPTRLTGNFIGYFDASLQAALKLPTDDEKTRLPGDFLTELQKNSMQFWTTYKHNFLFGQFMYIFDTFKSSLLVDMGPQVISQLISLLMQNVIGSAKSELVFTPDKSLSEVITVEGGHGKSESQRVPLRVTKGVEYVVRNTEMIKAIETAHPEWTMPNRSIEGLTQDSIDKDWDTNGFLSLLADQWNRLMTGDTGDLIANRLATSLTKKINKELSVKNLGTLEITPDGVKKMFSTAGNIAGLLEQDGEIVPASSSGANFEIKGTGPVSMLVKDYKSFMTLAAPILHDKFNFISILSNNSATSTSSYALPFGDLIKPKKGTFNYNLQYDTNVIIHLLLGRGRTTAATAGAEGENLITAGPMALEGLLPNLDDIIKTTIVGSQFNAYGIGLGQFFLCIGIWVGTLMQSFVYDRAKRVKTAKPWAWYLSKTTLMLVTAWIQTTILMLTVFALGWSVIGSSFGLMYLWMMFTATVFVIIQQALWFSVQDETVGKFLIIILLIINLSSGWGTFPPFMQAGFFNVISYIAPYTYSIHAQSVIIYSIAASGVNRADSLYVLQNFGILSIWIVVFTLLGLLGAVLRNRDMLYGTHKSKKLGKILLEENLEKYVDPKTNKAIWKELPKEEMESIAKKVKKRYPEEGQYKWFKKWKARHPDKPLTASKSDDEIMRRND